jgi:hypothetical protein
MDLIPRPMHVTNERPTGRPGVFKYARTGDSTVLDPGEEDRSGNLGAPTAAVGSRSPAAECGKTVAAFVVSLITRHGGSEDYSPGRGTPGTV